MYNSSIAVAVKYSSVAKHCNTFIHAVEKYLCPQWKPQFHYSVHKSTPENLSSDRYN